MDEHQECRYTGLGRECTLEELAAFHGHLGLLPVLIGAGAAGILVSRRP